MSTTDMERRVFGSLSGRFSADPDPASLLAPHELDLVRIVVEQVSVRSDQLVRFVGVDADRLDETLGRLEEWGWLGRRRFFVGEAEWIWASKRSCELFGLRFHRCEIRHLDHRYYVNEVRLQLAEVAPDGRWVSERFLRLPWGGPEGGEVPDGVFEVGGERHAIEVELSPKLPAALRSRLVSKAASHDAVVYFCGKRTFGTVAAEVARLGISNVAVRRLGCVAPRREYRPRWVSQMPPTAEEVAAARLVSEQGALRVDHLGSLLGFSPAELQEVVDLCCDRGSVGRRPGLIGEADWLWPRERAGRIAGTGLTARIGVSPTMFERSARAAEVRLRVEAADPDGRWESSRFYRQVVARREGKKVCGGGVDAVFHGSDGLRIGYMVVLLRPSHPGLRRRIRARSREFDRLVLVTSPRRAPGLAAFVEEAGFLDVGVEDFSGRAVRAPDRRPRRRVGVARQRPDVVEPLVRAVVCFCAEEGHLGPGQVEALTRCSEDEVGRALAEGVALGFLRDDRQDRDGRQLFVATPVGCEFSATGVKAEHVAAARRVPGRADVLVQARIELAVGVEGARWLSSRVLGYGTRGGGQIPWAVLERGGRALAVVVRMRPWVGDPAVVRQLERAGSGCDGVIVYCTAAARVQMERILAREGWDWVELRAVPSAIERSRIAVA